MYHAYFGALVVRSGVEIPVIANPETIERFRSPTDLTGWSIIVAMAVGTLGRDFPAHDDIAHFLRHVPREVGRPDGVFLVAHDFFIPLFILK